MSCLFCRIVKGELESEVVFDNDDFIVIKDIHPQAPTHLLVIPRRHYDTLTDCRDRDILAGLLDTAVRTAERYGFAESGYRCIINTGAGGGQTIFHLHLHIMSGRKFSEKMV